VQQDFVTKTLLQFLGNVFTRQERTKVL